MMPVSTDRQFDLCFPGKTSLFIVLGAQAVVGLGLLFWAILAQDGAPPLLAAFVWLGFVSYVVVQVLRTPHAILLSAEGDATFKSALRSRSFRLAEVRAIMPVSNQFGFFVLDYGRGTQQFLGQFTGFHEFVLAVKAANPTVSILGC